MEIKKNEFSTHFFYYKDQTNYFSASVFDDSYHFDEGVSTHLTIVNGSLEFDFSIYSADQLSAFSTTLSLFNKFFGG